MGWERYEWRGRGGRRETLNRESDLSTTHRPFSFHKPVRFDRRENKMVQLRCGRNTEDISVVASEFSRHNDKWNTYGADTNRRIHPGFWNSECLKETDKCSFFMCVVSIHTSNILCYIVHVTTHVFRDILCRESQQLFAESLASLAAGRGAEMVKF